MQMLHDLINLRGGEQPHYNEGIPDSLLMRPQTQRGRTPSPHTSVRRCGHVDHIESQCGAWLCFGQLHDYVSIGDPALLPGRRLRLAAALPRVAVIWYGHDDFDVHVEGQIGNQIRAGVVSKRLAHLRIAPNSNWISRSNVVSEPRRDRELIARGRPATGEHALLPTVAVLFPVADIDPDRIRRNGIVSDSVPDAGRSLFASIWNY